MSSRSSRPIADQPDDPVTAGGQQRRQRAANQAAGAGDRDRQRVRAGRAGAGVGGQVLGQLPVPVGEHRPQRPGWQRRLDHVGNAGGTRTRQGEAVGVPPRQHGRQREAGQRVGELVRRVVAAGLVSGHPPQPGRQPQHGLPVPHRTSLPFHPDRLPGRHQPDDGARPAVPGEHLAQRGVHHTAVGQSQRSRPPTAGPSGDTAEQDPPGRGGYETQALKRIGDRQGRRDRPREPRPPFGTSWRPSPWTWPSPLATSPSWRPIRTRWHHRCSSGRSRWTRRRCARSCAEGGCAQGL
jgi:hypothetical protein